MRCSVVVRGVYTGGEDILVIPTQTSKVFSVVLDSTSALPEASPAALSEAPASFLSPTAGSGAFLLAAPRLSSRGTDLDFSPDISMALALSVMLGGMIVMIVDERSTYM
jgi:hypothetical protein